MSRHRSSRLGGTVPARRDVPPEPAPDEEDLVFSKRGGDFMATEAEYEGWGGPRNYHHALTAQGLHVTRAPGRH